MWNVWEPGAGFPAAAPNHPEAVLAGPQAFQAVEKNTSKTHTNFEEILNMSL